MRLWHYELLPYLPDLQFKGQLREMIAITHTWRDKGKTNHLLINNVMDYKKGEFKGYFDHYSLLYLDRYGKYINHKYTKEFEKFAYDADFKSILNVPIFKDWHNKEYLRICMANLYEKYKFGRGKTKITEDQWNKLLEGYKKITKGEDYSI